MGISAESKAVMRLQNREGIALAAAIFGIVVISLITAGTFMLTDLDTKATKNREDAATALQLAHSAQAHALSLFRTHLNDTTINRLLVGWDNASGTADDGLFINWDNIDNTMNIPAAGRAAPGGTYYASIMDDPADGDANAYNDTNWRFMIRCAGETPLGSRAAIDFVVKYLPPLPAVTMNGNSVIQGNPNVLGACGNIHTNGNVAVSGNIEVNKYLTTSGTPSGSGNVLNAAGVSVGVFPVPDQIPIPTMTAAEYCPGAQYVLQTNGSVLRRSDNTLWLSAIATVMFGWSRTTGPPSNVVWTANSSMLSGSYCVEGNAVVSGNPGTVGTPVPVSIYATGSIQVSGNPNLSPYDSNNIVFLADGDLYIAGNSNTNYNGIMYGGSNCRSSGNLNLSGQLLCQTGPLPAGANDIVASNLIEGGPTFTYACTWSTPNDRYRIVSWYQRMGL